LLIIFGGAPASLARNSAAAEKRGRAKIPPPQPPSFLPARAQIFFKIQRPDFREKKFGFRSGFGGNKNNASSLLLGCIIFMKNKI